MNHSSIVSYMSFRIFLTATSSISKALAINQSTGYNSMGMCVCVLY